MEDYTSHLLSVKLMIKSPVGLRKLAAVLTERFVSLCGDTQKTIGEIAGTPLESQVLLNSNNLENWAISN